MPPPSSYSVRRSNGQNVARPWAPTRGRSPMPPPPPPRRVAPPPPHFVAPPPPPRHFAPPPPHGLVPPPPPPVPLPPMSPYKNSHQHEGSECVSSPSRPPTVSTALSSGSDSDSPVPMIPSVFRTISQIPPPPPSNSRPLPPTISMPSPMRAPSPTSASGKICFPLPSFTQSMAEDDENSTNSMRIPDFTLDEDLSHLSVGSDTCKSEEEKKQDQEDDSAATERNRISNLTKERDFWNATVTKRSVGLGSNHVRTAEAVMNLGIAEMRCKDYDRAVSCFQSAGRIFKKLYGPSNLGLAKALDKIGHAASQKEPATPERLTFALDSLEEAFKIRTELLGQSHVDTVETLNNMAGVYLKLDKLQIAKQTFHDVLMKRISIFDQMHPSVAVTAHTLASIHVSLKEMEDAYHYFNFAYAVYRAIGLPEDHPLLTGIMREVGDLDCAAYRVSL